MRSIKFEHFSTAALMLLLTALAGCTTGIVKDSNGVAVAGVAVTAYGQCAGEGCEASQVETATPAGLLTGYQTSSDSNGQYFYDPYGEKVAAEEAMTIAAAEGSDTYQLQYSQAGYQDVWLDYTPNFQQYSSDGQQYLITGVPEVYLCLDGAADSDGDGICDDAEAQYGTDPQNADSNGDGVYDDQALFGSGSPFATNLRALLHYNINVSDFEASKAFYQLLGFSVLLEVDVDVPDAAEAQGLNLAPYSLKAAPMILADGFIIDLIKFHSPYDDTAPHSDIYSLGLATLSLKTDNIQADMATLEANGIGYSILFGSETNPVTIQFADPDGTVILLSQVFEDKGLNSSGETYVHGVFSTNINVSDLAVATAFYQQAGFRLIGENKGIATLGLQDGRHFTLTESDSEDLAYEDVNHLGIARIAIETSNIDQDIQVLEAAGIEFYTSEAIIPSGPLSILRYVAFEDPDGTVIELVEYN
ncbi:VOC family protein [Oceanicoccus sagamiensis]|uniref:VOC domain-containing protein n=1 Tax=Oceanicoccus sagamiensis TaxID=716816 RepID=A0A1X9NE36_9GAMM|nr:VOC family protein [Oceanicoccus sagamiensis]ARN75826.1 hypothetical protein BST96_17975 [Oceanicoccus sagamiensis]